MYDVYLFGSRAAATAAILAASTGANPSAELIDAARQVPRDGADAFTAKQVANRLVSAAKRQGLPAPSPTTVARRLPELLKGKTYATLPYGDEDRTLVVMRAGHKPAAVRTLKKKAAERMEAARPALVAARAAAPRQLAA